MKNYPAYALVAALLTACGGEGPSPEAASTPAPGSTAAEVPARPDVTDPPERLAAVLAAQPEEVAARYPWRHPGETLAFFGIEPGMTVVEVLPGGGWYTRLLLPYLGEAGHLIGADYPIALYRNFNFMTDEALAKKEDWAATWPAQAAAWASNPGPKLSAFALNSLPDAMHGTADAVLFIRAFHNMARFADKGDFVGQALADAYAVLKPGGTVGVVQHRAPADATDAWADGSRGYLKQDWLIQRIEDAGFELVATSEVNANPADQPGEEDIVWRLAPSFATSQDDPERREELAAIGESDRMTLKFIKPGG